MPGSPLGADSRAGEGSSICIKPQDACSQASSEPETCGQIVQDLQPQLLRGQCSQSLWGSNCGFSGLVTGSLQENWAVTRLLNPARRQRHRALTWEVLQPWKGNSGQHPTGAICLLVSKQICKTGSIYSPGCPWQGFTHWQLTLSRAPGTALGQVLARVQALYSPLIHGLSPTPSGQNGHSISRISKCTWLNEALASEQKWQPCNAGMRMAGTHGGATRHGGERHTLTGTAFAVTGVGCHSLCKPTRKRLRFRTHH